MGAQSQVSIVVPAHNAEHTLARCLTSVLALERDGLAVDISVVDDASEDATAEIIRQFPVNALRSRAKNRAAARNAGIAASSAPILAFIDADCIAEPAWLRKMLAGFLCERVGAVQSAIVPIGPGLLGRYRELAAGHQMLSTAHRSSLPTVSAAGCAFRREALMRVGGFDESLSDYEDMDLSWRVLLAGYALAFATNAKLTTTFEPPKIGAFARRMREKGTAAALLFERWNGTLGLSQAELRSRCVNMRPLPFAAVVRYALLERRAEALLGPCFGLAYALGYRQGCRRDKALPFAHPSEESLLQPVVVHGGGEASTAARMCPSVRVVFDPDTVTLFDLSNGSATVGADVERSVWTCLLSGARSLEEIVERVRSQFSGSSGEVTEGIGRYFQQLIDAGVFVEDCRVPLR